MYINGVKEIDTINGYIRLWLMDTDNMGVIILPKEATIYFVNLTTIRIEY